MKEKADMEESGRRKCSKRAPRDNKIGRGVETVFGSRERWRLWRKLVSGWQW